GPHHLEQYLHAPGFIQAFEFADEIGERTSQNANSLPLDEAGIKPQRFTIGLRNHRLHDPGGHRGRSSILPADQMRHANRAAHRQPAVAPKIENYKKIAWENWSLHRPQLPGVTYSLANLWQIGAKALRLEMPLRLALGFGLGVNEKPPLVRQERSNNV